MLCFINIVVYPASSIKQGKNKDAIKKADVKNVHIFCIHNHDSFFIKKKHEKFLCNFYMFFAHKVVVSGNFLQFFHLYCKKYEVGVEYSKITFYSKMLIKRIEKIYHIMIL